MTMSPWDFKATAGGSIRVVGDAITLTEGSKYN